MIQRKQTIFLLLAVAAIIACLCMPIGEIEPKGMGVPTVWMNLGLLTDRHFEPQPLPFVDLVVASVCSFAAIFLYKKRKLQASLCTASVVILLAWYVYYVFSVFSVFQSVGTFHVRFAAVLPFVAVILLFMARRGIIADEKLVRSMDRIR